MKFLDFTICTLKKSNFNNIITFLMQALTVFFCTLHVFL